MVLAAEWEEKEEVCGAVSGGIMAIGTKFGKHAVHDQAALETTYKKTSAFMDRFAQKHGSYLCRKLLNDCELTTEEGQRHFKDQDLKNKVCVPCVQSAVDILEGILKDA